MLSRKIGRALSFESQPRIGKEINHSSEFFGVKFPRLHRCWMEFRQRCPGAWRQTRQDFNPLKISKTQKICVHLWLQVPALISQQTPVRQLRKSVIVLSFLCAYWLSRMTTKSRPSW
jgi:hypothetical protein